jgi:disulfide bond formation protein DsbB
MKKRLLYGWNMQRITFFLIGVILLVHTIMDQQYIGVFLGIYITAMGLFGFGCAVGNCSLDQTKK